VETKKKLKIGLISYRSNPFSGGQGIYIRHLSSALYDLGHDIEVISGPPYPDLRQGINLVKIPSLDLFSYEDRLKQFSMQFLSSYTDLFEWVSIMTGGFPEPYTFGRRLKKFLANKEFNYDVLHDNQSLASSLLELQKKFPLVTTIHHPISRDYNLELNSTSGFKDRLLIKRWHSFLSMQKRVANKLDNILCVSEQSAQDVSEDFNVSLDKISVVLNGVDMDVFFPNKKVKKMPHRIITTASADIPLKGLEYLIKSLPKILSAYPDSSLEVIGRAQIGGVVDTFIKDLNLQHVVNFNYGLSEKEIASLYNSSDLAVIPSLYEGFGFGAAEAMACGLPTISTGSGGLSEVIGDAAYRIVSGSEDAISHAVMDLFQDSAKKNIIADKGLERMKQEFTWLRAGKETISSYQEAINTFNQAK